MRPLMFPATEVITDVVSWERILVLSKLNVNSLRMNGFRVRNTSYRGPDFKNSINK